VHGRDGKYIENCCLVDRKASGILLNLGMCESIVLQLMLEKYCSRVRTDDVGLGCRPLVAW
jgi:hypothetical protein